MEKLLTRDDFRNGCLERDQNKCVICKQPAVDVHHILERRLFTDGGYYLSNGASLCSEHHIQAETTVLTCDEIRSRAGIGRYVIPEHFYSDVEYDKWGNILLPSGQRLKGELFYDGSVQKIIAPVLNEFSKYIKYPRTYHLPWSNLLKDDRMMDDDSVFEGKWVVVTQKRDGENTSMYNDYIHARSINMDSHESRDWIKGYWSQISYLIDDNMRLCGENLYAIHSIKEINLKSYFNLFSIWIDMTCLSWKETMEYTEIIGCETVPVIYEGLYNKNKIINAFNEYDRQIHSEGYVIRLADEFNYGDFRKSVGKFVKPEFRETVNNSHGHWVSKKVEINQITK